MDYHAKDLTPQLKLLSLLADRYPTVQAASSQIVALNAIAHMPKGTEHFMSDIHGEYVPFMHILKNASGVIKFKIDELFHNTLPHKERKVLATLIYYPREKLERIRATEPHLDEWYRLTLYRLVEVCRSVTSKYSRGRIRAAMEPEFAGVMEELITVNPYNEHMQEYYNAIFQSIVETHCADEVIVAISHLIQTLAVDSMHILGDVYDRGPGADIILDALMDRKRLDIQWGNHDIIWMGAAAGSPICIATVIQNSIKYNNFNTLEEGYGISLRPLITFAIKTYGDDPCEVFMPRSTTAKPYAPEEMANAAKMHKAIAVIAFKLEGQTVLRHPSYGMEDRLLLDKVKDGRVKVGDKTYPMLDCHFPTLGEDPYTLTEEETEVMNRMAHAFTHSVKLQDHVRFLYDRGGMYKAHNGNLLFHGCIPLTEDGDFARVNVTGETLSGPEYLDKAELLARQGYFALEPDARQEGMDFLWYLWCGPQSPLYGKNRMTSFERYFIADTATHAEEKDPYYRLNTQPEVCRRILSAFGLDPEKGHIINGHVPVRVVRGESPVKAQGKLLVIDGGLSRAYQNLTGTAGYTLIGNSHGLFLACHEPFTSTEAAIEDEKDMHSRLEPVEIFDRRKMIADTDLGSTLQEQMEQLRALIAAYRLGLLRQHTDRKTVQISWMDREND